MISSLCWLYFVLCRMIIPQYLIVYLLTLHISYANASRRYICRFFDPTM
ncbi:unnamed protein product [Linum tenue]|uniref:Uncharacterized protein n=1 Tax=Linum tenue TaxID=586396 RepID=A0AAV0MFQ6_9ROSI|nr:unnamed protein product [Linum tenue]